MKTKDYLKFLTADYYNKITQRRVQSDFDGNLNNDDDQGVYKSLITGKVLFSSKKRLGFSNGYTLFSGPCK